MAKNKKKGQYFSADVLVAVVIFLFSFSVLLNYWHAIKSQSSAQKDFLYSEAIRLSELLISEGDYNVSGKSTKTNYVNWYDEPESAAKAGLGAKGFKNKLVYEGSFTTANRPTFNTPKLYLVNQKDDPYYKSLKALFGTYLDFYVDICLYNLAAFSSGQKSCNLKKEFGLKPTNAEDVFKVRRVVYSSFSPFGSGTSTQQYVGYMDIYIWQSK
ncbi:MAG: hypothetical protein QXV83_04045 [Candidatus Anstonellaceae archaeon]